MKALNYNLDGYIFTYRPSKGAMVEALASLIMTDLGCTYEVAKMIISFCETADVIYEVCEYYEDALKECFEEEARLESGCDEPFDRDDAWCRRQEIM